jgi:hypothetical protein
VRSFLAISARARRWVADDLAQISRHTLSAFWTWLRKQGRVSTNPFEIVERADTHGKERIQRRALSDAEVVQLLQLADKNRLAYMLPLYAGLRRTESGMRRWPNLVLGESGGLLRIPAALNQNRKGTGLLPCIPKSRRRCGERNRRAKRRITAWFLAKWRANDQSISQGVGEGIPFLDEHGRSVDFMRCGRRLSHGNPPLRQFAKEAGLRRGLFDGQLLLDLKFLDALAQCGAGNAQQLGGLDLVAAGFKKGLDDEFAFDSREDFEFGVLAGPLKKYFAH